MVSLNIKILLTILLLPALTRTILAQERPIDQNNVVWNSPSKNAAGSMPCGGGDVGLNVWVENGDLLFYIARSGAFDENNSLLKLGRIRLTLSPNPWKNGRLRQELTLRWATAFSVLGIRVNGVVAEHWEDEPEEIANMVLFLLSQRSRLVNGELVHVDG